MKINNWRYENGEPNRQELLYGIDPAPAGYYCWVYPDNNDEFEQWMKQTFRYNDRRRRAGWEHRFNGGDPMYTVYIKKEPDAILFQLKWGGGENDM